MAIFGNMTREQLLKAVLANQDAINRLLAATANRMPTLKERAAIEHHQLAISKLHTLLYGSN